MTAALCIGRRDFGGVRRADNQIDPRRRDVADAVLDQHLAEFEPPQDDENAVRVESADDLQDLTI